MFNGSGAEVDRIKRGQKGMEVRSEVDGNKGSQKCTCERK